MTKKEIVLSILLGFCIIFYDVALKNKDEKIFILQSNIVNLEKSVEKNKVKLFLFEEKISIMDQSIEPKNKRWAKVKKVRDVIQKELKSAGTNYGLQINEITSIAASIVDYSEEFGIKTSLVMAIVRRESHFNPLAVSKTNAQGLMQLLPSTAKECADDLGKKYFNTFKISDNIHLGSWYIWKMLNRFKNDDSLAIRAYNAGPVYVDKVLSGDIVDYPLETKKYVVDVLESKQLYEQQGL